MFLLTRAENVSSSHGIYGNIYNYILLYNLIIKRVRILCCLVIMMDNPVVDGCRSVSRVGSIDLFKLDTVAKLNIIFLFVSL